MAPVNTSRKYDLLLLGASGYTGKHTAEHIAGNLPTDLRWAIAGRSLNKLEELARKLRHQFPDRLQPSMIEAVSVEDSAQVAAAVKQSRVCISVVLYGITGETVVRACAENGCDYVDCAALPPLLQTWIKNYDRTARDNGIALIHGAGASALPMDVMVWSATRDIASKWGAKTKDSSSKNLSAGTIRTVLGQAALASKVIQDAQKPSALSPVKHTGKDTHKRGVHRDPIVGVLSNSSVTANQNRAIIYRSWGLLEGTGRSYGPNFAYSEYEKANSAFSGVVKFLQFYLVTFLISIARLGLMGNFLLSLAPEPGTGPTDEVAWAAQVGMEMLAEADTVTPGRLVNKKFLWKGGNYPLTAMLMSQTAASLLYNRELEGGIKGGCLTPAILGGDLVERVTKAGGQISTTLIGE
ncbi:hypothetical protein DL768_002588 [Monosporascus sp. mg162]|nr:hypothetical protein DL768_002588 [Monosporascus sp. mg162]